MEKGQGQESSFIVKTLTIFEIDKENQTLLELRKHALTCTEKENTRLGNTVIDNKVSFSNKFPQM